MLLFEEGTDNITQNFDLDVLFYCLHPLEEFLAWYRGYLGPTFLRSFPPTTYPATRARDADSTTCDGTTTSHISVICISSRASSQSVFPGTRLHKPSANPETFARFGVFGPVCFAYCFTLRTAFNREGLALKPAVGS